MANPYREQLGRASGDSPEDSVPEGADVEYKDAVQALLSLGGPGEMALPSPPLLRRRTSSNSVASDQTPPPPHLPSRHVSTPEGISEESDGESEYDTATDSLGSLRSLRLDAQLGPSEVADFSRLPTIVVPEDTYPEAQDQPYGAAQESAHPPASELTAGDELLDDDSVAVAALKLLRPPKDLLQTDNHKVVLRSNG